PYTSHRPLFILTDTTAAHGEARIISNLVELRCYLVLSKFPGQPPGLPWPASAAHQISDKLFDQLVAVHSEPDQTFPLLIAVRLATWFPQLGHLAF
ncbi:MAG: hypothetical protein LC808_41675, partial [Actinobacteria bacterium]|nr:hypothetical protein [Actinomycetota bacterium]